MSDLSPLSGRVEMQGAWGGMVRPDDRRQVRFETVMQESHFKSMEAGRPVYEPVEVMFVRQPGERDETAVKVREHHKYEFPRQWAAYQEGRAPIPEGTPLDILFPADKAIVHHLRTLGVFVVEQLASLTEEGQRRVGMGVRDYVARAQKFLEMAEKAAPMQQMRAELEQRDAEIQALKDQMAMLAQAATRRPRRRAADEGDE